MIYVLLMSLIITSLKMPLINNELYSCLCHLNDIIESYSGHVIRLVFYARWNSDWGSIEVLRGLYILKPVLPLD
jgi:hypothetical protein